MSIKNFTRVKVIEDFSTHSHTLPAGTIGTKREELDNGDLVLIQYGYKNNVEQYIGIPMSLLVKASDKDIKKVNPLNLIPSIYHFGNAFETKEGIGIINKIKLSTNEEQDLFTLKFKDGTIKDYSKKYLEDNCSYIPSNCINISKDENNNDSNIIINNELLTVIINDIDIKIDKEGQISIHNLTIDNIDKINKSLTKLQNWIRILKGGEKNEKR
ncbi:MAG: hypothetical protein ACOC2W_02470 [bacterium]